MKSAIIIMILCLGGMAQAQISIGGSLPKVNLKKKEKEESKQESKNENKNTVAVKEKTENSTPKMPKEERDRILASVNKWEYIADCKRLEKIDQTYNNSFEFGVVAYTIKDAIAQMDSLPLNRKRAEEIHARYAAYWQAFKESEGRDETKQSNYYRAVKGMNEFEKRVKTGYTDVSAKINNYLGTARTNAEKLFAEKKIKDKSSNRDYYIDQVGNEHAQAYYHLNILRFQKGAEDPELKTLWAKYESEVAELGKKRDEVEKAIRMQEISSVQCPAEVYGGADKAALKAGLKKYWAKQYPEDKVLNMYFIDKNWVRQSGQNWNSNYNRFEKYDNSWLMVNVVIQDDKDPSLGIIYEANIQKNHMSNNEISYAYFSKALGIGKGYILKSKVK